MSLLSSNITKRKKLSLKDARLPAPEERVKVTPEPVKDIERPIGEEEIAYNKLLEKNPLLDTLIDTFGLVNNRTGEKLRKAPISDFKEPQEAIEAKVSVDPQKTDKEPGEPLKKPQQAKANPKLFSLASTILQEEYSLSKEEIQARLQEETKVNQERAEVGFNMMLESGVVIQVNELNSYYLQGSTPF